MPEHDKASICFFNKSIYLPNETMVSGLVVKCYHGSVPFASGRSGPSGPRGSWGGRTWHRQQHKCLVRWSSWTGNRKLILFKYIMVVPPWINSIPCIAQHKPQNVVFSICHATKSETQSCFESTKRTHPYPLFSVNTLNNSWGFIYSLNTNRRYEMIMFYLLRRASVWSHQW